MEKTMKRTFGIVCLLTLTLGMTSCSKQNTKTLGNDELRDKIAGGWAGKMIGVAYGAPTEFRARGETYEKEIEWEPSFVANSLRQDDIYVQLSFMMAMDKYGIDAPAHIFAESFATAGYRLWHANVQARKNFFDGIMPPQSGSPEFNLHADDIDFQIEADYIGFMCPGMPQAANKIADKVGHIMNYGDGVYGGMYVAALYSEAFFETDITKIVDHALLSIPEESGYAKCIRDVIALHAAYPGDWRTAWQKLEDKWGNVDICGALEPFNIDAKLNGAYIVMGLLYGGGDFAKTLEISTRCGQDSDCNPSNAAAVIGVINGYSGIPEKWKSGITSIADSLIIFTDYSFNSAVDNTVKYAQKIIEINGGKVTGNGVKIFVQEPVAPPLEDAFPNVVPSYLTSVFDEKGWEWQGDWNVLTVTQRDTGKKIPTARYTGKTGAEVKFTFTGTGVVLRGDWRKDGGQADIYVDGEFHRKIDTYYFWANEEKHNSFLWHVMGLEPGEHTVSLVVNGLKKPQSIGTQIYLKGATVFKTGTKKNETVDLTIK